MHFLHKCCHRRVAGPPPPPLSRLWRLTAAPRAAALPPSLVGEWRMGAGPGSSQTMSTVKLFYHHTTNRGPTPLMTKNDTLLEQRHIVNEWIKKKLGAILVEINFWNWISVLLDILMVEDRFWDQAKNWLKSSHSMTQQFDINRLKSDAPTIHFTMWTESSSEWAIISLNTRLKNLSLRHCGECQMTV